MFDDPVLGPLASGEVEPEVTVRLAALGLPSPRGQALPRAASSRMSTRGTA